MQDEMLYDNFARVRFMCLLPGGWIRPHQDTQKVEALGATNVAINNPDGCSLVMEEYGTMPFTPAVCLKLIQDIFIAYGIVAMNLAFI